MGSVICEITGRSPRPGRTTSWPRRTSGSSCPLRARRPACSTRIRSWSTARKRSAPRLHQGIDGELILKEAPLDPVADLVVRRMVDLNWTERASTQVGRVIGPVPQAGLEPFIHQRYDDLSVLGAGPSDERALHDHLGRRPRRVALARSTGPTSTRSTTGQFDEYLAERHANRDQQLQMNYDYIMGWETDNEEGLRGAWDIEQRDKELDADGVTAEVMFADADAITGMASPPFGAGLRPTASATPSCLRRPQGTNQLLAEVCCTQPGAPRWHRTGPHHPRCRALGRRDRVAGSPAGHPRDHGAHDVARPRALQPPRLRPRVGRLPGRRVPGAHPLG